MQKHFSGGGLEWVLILLSAAVLLLALFLPLRMALADDASAEEKRLMDAWRNGEVIRIHIIANSDAPEDQAVKLKVRDALINAFGSLLANVGEQGSEEAFALLQAHLPAMRLVARQCAAENGFEGDVRAEAGVLNLPARRYGRVVLPAGKYRGLRVIIGEGKGQNWWCVLYPQLCLSLAQAEGEPEAKLSWSSKRIFRQWLLWN